MSVQIKPIVIKLGASWKVTHVQTILLPVVLCRSRHVYRLLVVVLKHRIAIDARHSRIG
jgi:hypothetical protein